MERIIIKDITTMITWLGFFTAVFLTLFYYLRYRSKERMLLIEKNVDLSELYKKRVKSFPWFIVGFVLLGFGFGTVMVVVLEITLKHQQLSGIPPSFILIGLSILFGAIGMIIGHVQEQKKKK